MMSVILDHWDMRTDRNPRRRSTPSRGILDHWDMRTDRNWIVGLKPSEIILDHWDMRTDRNAGEMMGSGLEF